jgi:hypothetical protein
MEYLRAFSSITSREQWWVAPLALGGISIAFLILGLIPFVGILISLLGIPFGIYVQGWVAASQRLTFRNEQGLPDPFDVEYFVPGLRAFVVTLVWMLVLLVPLAVGGGVLGFAAMNFSGDRGFGGGGIGIVEIGVALFAAVAAFAIFLWMPLTQIAMTRTNLANDWSGLDFVGVFRTFFQVPIEAYLGLVIWFFVGFGIVLAGMMACFVGVYVAQTFLYAAMGVFWVDIYRLAVQRGAPAVATEDFSVREYARTFE